MKVSTVPNSHLAMTQNLQSQVSDLQKSVGRGVSALRDPSGSNVMQMASGEGPTLVSSEQDTGIVMRGGQLHVTTANGTDPAPLTAADVTSSGGTALTTSFGLPALISKKHDTAIVSNSGVMYFTNAANQGYATISAGPTSINGNHVVTANQTVQGSSTINAGQLINGDLHVTGNIVCDNHGQFGSLDSTSGIGTPANINAGTVNSTFYGIIYPQVQGPVGPQGPEGPPGPQGPAGTCTTVSERALKNHLGELENSPEVIAAIRTGRFTWRDPETTPGADRQEHDGLYVDELAEVAPQSVHVGPDGSRHPDDRSLIAHLIKTVQQLMEDRDALAARVATLEAGKGSV